MKQGRSLEALAQEIARQAETKQDYLMSTKALNFTTLDEGKFTLDFTAGETARSFAVKDTCHTQLAEHCQIPARYYELMRKQGPALLQTNVNYWLHHEPAKRMLRTLDGGARAFLSDRYRPFDNYDLANTILPRILEEKWDIQSCEVTGDRFYLKVVAQSITAEIEQDHVNVRTGGKTHIVHPGITVRNSETGLGALSIMPSVHWEHCLNLATMSQAGIRRAHAGKSMIEVGEFDAEEYYSPETRQLDDRAFWGKVKDVLHATLNREVFLKMIESFQRAKDDQITTEDIPAVVEVVQNTFSLSKQEGNSILTHLIQGGDLSRYGLSSAITRMSQDVESYDRASELEILGGRVIELPTSDWTRIARGTATKEKALAA